MEYIVQPGDTMFAIAQRFGVGLAALLAANPEIANPDLIFPGQVVRIPLLPPTRPPVGRVLYVVQPGDTLSAIARRFQVDLTALIQANPQIPDPDLIFPGQVVFVPTRPVAPSPPVLVQAAPVPPAEGEPELLVEVAPEIEVKLPHEAHVAPPECPPPVHDLHDGHKLHDLRDLYKRDDKRDRHDKHEHDKRDRHDKLEHRHDRHDKYDKHDKHDWPGEYDKHEAYRMPGLLPETPLGSGTGPADVERLPCPQLRPVPEEHRHHHRHHHHHHHHR